MPPRPLLALLVVLPLGLTACGGSSGPATLTVFAASSLTEAFGELGRVYEQAHRDVKVRFVFAGSQELVERLRERQAADVLVTADEVTMTSATKLVGGREAVARTTMTIAVTPGNPKRIRGLADLTRPGLRVVLGAPTVPVGRYARQILTKAGLNVRVASEEISARSVLDRVRTGEADAGIVYVPDMRSAGAAASSVPIPATENVTARYLAAPIKKSGHPEAAGALVGWLTTAEAGKVLNKYGFTTP